MLLPLILPRAHHTKMTDLSSSYFLLWGAKKMIVPAMC